MKNSDQENLESGQKKMIPDLQGNSNTNQYGILTENNGYLSTE